MKNTVLTFVTGMALGGIAMGIGIIDLNTPLALSLLIPGALWTIPFVWINRKHEMISWLFD